MWRCVAVRSFTSLLCGMIMVGSALRSPLPTCARVHHRGMCDGSESLCFSSQSSPPPIRPFVSHLSIRDYLSFWGCSSPKQQTQKRRAREREMRTTQGFLACSDTGPFCCWKPTSWSPWTNVHHQWAVSDLTFRLPSLLSISNMPQYGCHFQHLRRSASMLTQ